MSLDALFCLRPYTGPVSAAGKAEGTPVNKKILIVDDSATVRKQVCAALSSAGFEVVEAADGVEGLQAITDRDDFAAVVCDVNMPRMGGLEMLELVKSRGKLAALPVLMLTTEGQSALVKQAKAVGAKGWMVKPFKGELLAATIRKLTSV
jgi:two-component system, chemotaxis family, chemotaxis protein CheY